MARLAAAAAAVALFAAGCGSGHASPSPPSRANGEIVFSVFDNIPAAQCGGLFAVDPASRRIRALADGVLQPSVSPDGSRMTVARLTEGTGEIPGELLYRYDRAGGTVSGPTKNLLPFGPVWAPDGSRFLVYGGTESHIRVEAVDAATGARHLVVSSPDVTIGLAWSGAGDRVAYTVEKPDLRWSLWTAAPDGGDAKLLVRHAADPTWSPDGRWIAYWDDPGSQAASRPLGLVRADGSGAHAAPGGLYLHRPVRALAFSPDGRRLMLLKPPRSPAKSSYEDADLVVQDVDATRGGAVVARNVIPVGWSPDGRQILVLRPRDVEQETVFAVAVIDPDGTHERTVAVIDEQDVNGNLSFPAWAPRAKPIAPLERRFPAALARACVPRLAALRDRLARR